MTIKLEDKMLKLGQSIDLTFDEREAIRARLLSKIARSERKIFSPFSPMFYWQSVSMYVKPQYVSVALLVILIGGGVSFAAENALPGEPLYQVKTSVNENVLGLFAFTPQSKAQLHTELVVRRLEEVEKLAIAGKLDATTTAQAEVKIDSNLAVIKDSVKQLENSNNSAAAADTSSKAESSLKVHEAILDTLASSTTAVNSAVQDMAKNVNIQATALSLDRAGIDSRSSSSTLSINALITQQSVAQDAIGSVQDEVNASTTGTSTPKSVITAKAKLAEAFDILKQGGEKFNAKDYGEAFLLFKKAEKTALDARAVLQAGDVVEEIVIPVETPVATSTATSTETSVATTTPLVISNATSTATSTEVSE